jgi:hypothetical protein
MDYGLLTKSILLEVDRLKSEGYSIETIQQGISEGMLDQISDAAMKGIKDKIAEGLISGLGFNPQSFSALVIRNAFALAPFADYPKIISGDCDVIAGLVGQSVIKTFVDQFANKYVADNFLTSSLKFGIMEAIEQSNIGQFVEKEIKPQVCGAIKKGWSSISSYF